MGFNNNAWSKDYSGESGVSKIGKPATTKTAKKDDK